MNQVAINMAYAVLFLAAGMAELVIFKRSGYWPSAVGAILGAVMSIITLLATLRRVIRENESKH